MGNAMSKPLVERNDYWFYALVCNDENIFDFYIGSTKNWIKRKSKHKHDCNDGTDYKVYEYINGYGGWDNWSMIEICFQKQLTKLEARIMEDVLMDGLGSTLNENAAYLSIEDLMKYNVERGRRNLQCECGMVITSGNIAKHRKRAKHIRRLKQSN
jgi:hypothetical protein